jgi:enamine deaminase RidA (YjgF/YER057c/UK114 family)
MITSSSHSESDARFAALAPTLSARPGPDAAVQPLQRDGNLIMMSGQVAFTGPDLLATGVLGAEIDVPTGQRCARQCAINLLGRLQEELGSLAEIRAVLKLTVFIASAPGFREQHIVANGASDLFMEVLGERGRHARSAVGVAELPLGTPVEVEAVIAV